LKHTFITTSIKLLTHGNKLVSNPSSPIVNSVVLRLVQHLLYYYKKFQETFQRENKRSNGILGNISFVEMEFSILINYLTNMCQSGQDTIVVWTTLAIVKRWMNLIGEQNVGNSQTFLSES